MSIYNLATRGFGGSIPLVVTRGYYVPAFADVGAGWAKKKKKQDPLKLKIEEEQGRHASILQAIYGPEIQENDSDPPQIVMQSLPPNVGELAKIISTARHRNFLTEMQQADDDEEEELSFILNDIL